MNDYLNKNKSIREKKIKSMKSRKLLFLKISLLALIVVFSVLYLYQINKISTKGFEISKLEKDVATLEYENKSIQVEIANYSSIENLKERLKDKKMLAVNEIKYISVIDNNIAQR